MLTGRLRLPEARYKDDAALGSFADRALERCGPSRRRGRCRDEHAPVLWRQSRNSVILAEGHVMAPGESVVSPHSSASPGYFELMRIPLPWAILHRQ